MHLKLLFFTLLMTSFCFGQTTLPVNGSGKIEYSAVIQADSTTAPQLFSNAKQYFATAFVSAKDVTQLADQDARTIVIKYMIPVSWKSFGITQSGFVRPTLTIQMKDGKYRYSFTDFLWDYQAGTMGKHYTEPLESKPGAVNAKQWESIKEQTDQAIHSFINQMTAALKTKSDW